MDQVKKSFEEAALLGCVAVKEFLASTGVVKEQWLKAKVGVGAMGGYARLRATMANEVNLTLIARRLDQIDAPSDEGIGSTAIMLGATVYGPGCGDEGQNRP